MNDKKLFLIDGHALVYRAYFAFVRNPLINSKGQPTSAVFGFANYLIRLIETYDCPHMAVVMDSSKPTFRHELYSQYKANREEMPDDLKTQLPLIHRLIDAFNIPAIKQDGLEADDLIAALTKRALKQNYEVFLVTKDKDLMQLVSPRVKMLAPEGTGVLQMIGVEDVIAKMGVRPERIVDYLALIGDSSDNIPGVPGVGPKTALKILETGDSVDKILQDPSILVNPKLVQKIEENREILCISKILATLKDGVEIEISIDELRRKPVQRELCLSLFRELEFTSLLKNPLFGGAPRLKTETHRLSSLEEVRELSDLIKKSKSVTIDTQTTSLLPRAAKLTGITLALNSKEGYYIPVGHTNGQNLPLQETLDILRDIIESAEVAKNGQNLKYDYQLFKNYGLCMKGIWFDTMVAAYLLDPGKRHYDLDLLSTEWLKIEITPITMLIGKESSQKSFADIEVEAAALYAGEVICVTHALKAVLEPLLEERNLIKLFSEVEMPLVPVLGNLEWHGMLIDTNLLADLSREYTSTLECLSESIFQLTGESLNLNSPKQIGEVLFNKLGLPGAKKTKTGNHSTNVEVLEKLAPEYPVVQKILQYREAQKLLSTYIDALPGQVLSESGRVHTSFNQTIAATGRLSSTNPNLQNIPIRTDDGKRIREAFIATPGCVLIAADYSQIELRILAHLTGDPYLIEAFVEDKDIHSLTASAIYNCMPELVSPEMRRVAKTINFGLMYGMGPINLSRQLSISFNEARTFIESYFHQFPKVKNYMETTILGARETGYVETLLGRRRYLPEINAKNRTIREAAERTAINTPVQGTAADIIKIAMIHIDRELAKVCSKARMLLQVHDELVFEVPEEAANSTREWIVEKMSCAFELKVPVRVDAGIGKNWSLAH